MKKCFLVTGATGFLGSHVVKKLVAEGQNVVLLKRSFSNISRLASVMKNVKSYDIDKLDDFAQVFDDQHIDVIIHTATCYGRQGEAVEQIYDVNLHFPLKLLELALRFNTDTFFNTDTILSKYLNWYALSKKQFSEIGQQFAGQGKINFIDAKLEHMYGEDDANTKFVTYVIEKLQENIDELKLTKGEQCRDFIYVDDVVEAYWKILCNQNEDKKYQQYEVGTGKAVSIKELVTLAKSITKSQTRLAFGAVPYRENEIMDSKANIESLQKLGWQPRMDLEAGIRKIVGAGK
ncbi:NAD-dependent epimerase/dehydratase family protein [Selenomonas ruminantium]|uniref:Nucleoside-diphosphate-sugar epimerase n=1 Tax=Selenomonas ruminantium TaxID=971 RepID=A0A1H0NYT9_SELRU|nr:NAD(P)-dependent oxidoreductase [Selenomonas ruminantium]SDO97779.1 Nucleoside-diphosphate-sugar epimerase [Selenomonas ruminantium]